MPKKPEMVVSKPKSANGVIAKGAPSPSARIQLSLYTTPQVLNRIETARKSDADLVLDRNHWLRLAVIEKLKKDGF